MFEFFLFVLLLQVPPSTSSNSDFEYFTPLDTDSHFTLAWSIDSTRKGGHFRFCHTASTDQLAKGRPDVLGIGFSSRGDLTNADVLVFWRHSIGIRWNYQDCHTDRRGIIQPDREDDYKVTKMYSKGIDSCFEFYRKFVTHDRKDYQIDTGTTHVLAFRLQTLPPFRVPYLLRLNSLNPSLQRIQIIKSAIPVPPLPSDTQTFDMRVNKLEIPAAPTTYWCKTALLPKMRKKHHIIRYDGIITPSSVGIVHHMEVFHCESPPGERIRHYDAPCNSETKPMGLTQCRKVIGAWAMGASGFSFPKEAGYPIGGADYSPYVIIEVHYNNPKRKKGLIDSSGLRFYITRQLRPHDAGLMELGLEYEPKNSIPPRQRDFTLSGYCVAECTKKAFGSQGIVIFGSQLHTHLTGVKVMTSHSRGKHKLPDLNRDDHYSPHFQEIRLLQKMVYVHPGDDLVTSCTYNTLERENMTYGGIAITNEMCLNYVFYYPRIDLELCKSSLADVDLDSYFSYSKLVDGARTSPNKTVEENYSAIDWNDSRAHELAKYYNLSRVHMSCNTSSGHEFPGQWNAVETSTSLQ